MKANNSSGGQNARVVLGAGLAVAATAIAASILTHSDAGQSKSQPVQSGPEPTAAQAPVQTFPAVGATLVAPPPGTNASITSADAIASVRADGMRSDIQNSIKPIASLAIFDNSALSAYDRDATPPSNIFKDLLVWDVVFPDAPQELHAPVGVDTSGIEPLPCDLHVIVNARTGEVVEGFQVGCSVAKAP